MKKFAVLILTVMIGFTAFGQGKSKEKGGGQSENLVARLQKMLKLDEAQMEKLNKIQDDTKAKIVEIRAKGKELKDREYVKTEVKKVRDTSEEKIKAILSDEQKARFEKWQTNREEKRSENAEKREGNENGNAEKGKGNRSEKAAKQGGNRKEGKGSSKKEN